MPIDLDRNGNYGGTTVTQKYSPLEKITYSTDDKTIYSALLTNREQKLADRGMWPANLGLVTPSWDAIVTAESPAAAARLPPLVVVSSNRSNWIAAGLAVAAAELPRYDHDPAGPINDVADLRALAASDESKQSPPIYAPARVGANRNVYVVVHAAEYAQYKDALAGSGITVVGWAFRHAANAAAPANLTGFGATRFAAIEFCKRLRQRAHTAAAAANPASPVPWNYAWLFDDNVVALTSFPGLATVEAALRAPAAPHVAVGFSGGGGVKSAFTDGTWARKEVKANRFAPLANVPVAAPKGLIQQASLWNIEYLAANSLNFGRVFVASGEDVSLAAYLDYLQRPYIWYDGIGVVKEEVLAEDGSKGAKTLKGERAKLTKVFVDSEAASPAVAAPPVPLMVKPKNGDDGGAQILRTFVVDKVLPNSQMTGNANDAGTQDIACCQAVEQLICGAIKQGAAYIGAAPLAASLSSFPVNFAVQESDRP